MFTTRIELHRATYDDYEKLHAEMASRGFTRTIVSDNGTTYALPTAEYNYVGARTCEEVRELARTAANATGKNNWILASEASARSWYLDEE